MTIKYSTMCVILMIKLEVCLFLDRILWKKEKKREHTHTHTHTHTCWFLWFTGTLHRRNGFYTEQTVCAIALHLPYT